ncbi:hypothetical protein WG622_12685 [Cognatishimia sp. D5M38]|uniref:Uncharacterized protein n=1 Tax=Cognatishimia coralii TaxID=3083254 RepID=A0ABU8QI58_9RHOB
MTAIDLQEIASKVEDFPAFLAFLEAMRKDWANTFASAGLQNPNTYGADCGWENTTIDSFLEAAVAGARDNRLGDPDGTHYGSNPWKLATEVLLLGKLYE